MTVMTETPIYEAIRRQKEGMERAENAADPRVMAAIDAAIARANASGRRWSANDIRDELPVSHRSLVGARVNAAANRKPDEMVAVGRTKSNLPSTHRAEIKVWIGAEYAQERRAS